MREILQYRGQLKPKKLLSEAVTRRCSVKKGTAKKCLKTHKKSRYNEIPFDKGCRAGPLEFSN